MRKINVDTSIALFLLLLCGGLWRETFYFRVSPYSTMSAGVWPRVIIALLAVLSFIYLLQSLRAANSAIPRMNHRNAILCFGLFTLFLIALPYLGMLIGGILFVFLLQTALGPRDRKSHWIHLAVAVASVGGMWAVFQFGLRVILPEGFLRF